FSNRLTNVENHLQGVKTNLKGVKTDLQGVKTDLEDVKTNLQGLKGNATNLTTYVDGLTSVAVNIQLLAPLFYQYVVGAHASNWHALKRDYFRLKKKSIKNAQTTFEIIITHRNIIGHCIELLTMIQPDKSIAFNASITHIIVNQTDVIVDYAYKHDFIPIDFLTMWEIYLPIGEYRIDEHKHVHIDVNGVKGTQRKGCCIRLLISCLR
ncbi:unnamed protein product, partial [Rotaria sp. Silwood1]